MSQIREVSKTALFSAFRFCHSNRNLVYALALLLLVPTIVFGQADTGTLSGTVRDTSGAVVPDAMVNVRNTATGVTRTAQTGTDGVYTFPALPPAPYDVTVSKTGFADYKAQTTITVGGHVTLDAPLSVSQVSTTVEVVAIPVSEINTQTQEVSQIITPEQVQQLPSLTRNPYDFVALAGNVSAGDRTISSVNPQLAASGGQNTTTYRGAGFSINGQRLSDTEILLDGAENINIFDNTIGLLIPQDAVQEFRVITNNFDAQYGRAAGGIVNVATKSGTNSFHGDAWEFNRLSAYTANTFDNNAAGTPKGQYARNQFGYDVGGPIKKDKLFFYQSTEWLRVRSSANILALVPDPSFLSATSPAVQSWFAAYGAGASFNKVGVLTKSQVPFNASAACATLTAPPTNCGLFDSTIASPTAPIFDLVSYSAPQSSGGDLPQNTYSMAARLDYNLTQNTQLFFRYGRESLATLPGAVFASPYPQYDVGQTIYNNNFLLSANHTFGSNVLSSTKLSFFRDDEAQNYNTALQETPTLLIYNVPSGSAVINGQPIQFPGFFDFNSATGGLPFGGPQNTIQISEDISWTHGKHNIKYGGQFNYIQLNRGYGAYAQAIESVGKSNVANGLDNMMGGLQYQFQKAINPAGQFPCGVTAYTGAGSSGLMTLTPTCTFVGKYPIGNPAFNRSDRYKDWALYAEDSWRVTPKFTFNYGLRYEHFGVQHNNNPNLDSNFYYGPGANIFQQTASGGVLTVPNSPIKELWKPRWGTAAPRIGFAYDLRGNGTTVIRGGYGITYARNFGNVTFNIVQNVPNNATVTILNTPLVTPNLGPFAGSGPTTCGATASVKSGCGLPPVSPRDVDQNIQVAATQFWGLTLEHKLGAKSTVEIDYNGAHGVHLYDIKNINPIGGAQVYLGQPLSADPTNAACAASTSCLSRVNPFYTNINNRGTNAFSHYNSLNVRFSTEELGHTGLFILSNYTYAHALDNLSSTFSESNTEFNLGYLDPTNPWLDYGNSDFDLRHRLALELNWSEPFFKSGKGVFRQAAGGWSISPIFTIRSGSPFSVWDSTTSLGMFIPRYVPTGPISLRTGTPVDSGSPNLFNLSSLPPSNSISNPNLDGISDFGPFPPNMTTRNMFYGPGAWNFDLAVAKTFALTERFSLEFRAEAYDILNHTNMYVVTAFADQANFLDPVTSANTPISVQGKKGGLGLGSAEGVNTDERRFGQFALRLHF